MAQQTAVEWFGARIYDLLKLHPSKLEAVNFLAEQAKQMAKDQITTAYKADRHPCSDEDAQQYYNETFGKS